LITVADHVVQHDGVGLVVTFPDGRSERLVASGDASSSTPPVQAQLEAYNKRNLDAFVAPYAPECLLQRGTESETFARAVDGYRTMFHDFPDLHAWVPNRLVAGGWVADEELVTGHRQGELRAIALYRVADSKIVEVRFLP
jgi:hypothetical protein